MMRIVRGNCPTIALLFAALFAHTLHAQPQVWQRLDGPRGGKVARVLPVPDGRIFVAMSGAQTQVFVSSNDGSSWDSLGAFGNSSLYWFNYSAKGYLVATDYQRIYRKDLRSNSPWESDTLPSFLQWSSSAEVDSVGNLYVLRRAIWRSSDLGRTWSKISSDSVGGYSLVVSPSGRILLADSTIRYSDDTAKTWKTVYVASSLLTLHQQADGTMIALWPFLISGDRGVTWTLVQYGFRSISSPVVDGSDLWATEYFHFRHSSDLGITWEEIRLVDSQWIGGLEISRRHSLFMINQMGIYRSTDKGMQWDNVSPSVPYLSSLATSRRYLYALSYPGIYRMSVETGEWTELRSTTQLYFTIIIPLDDRTIMGYAPYYGMYQSNDNGSTWSPVMAQGIEANPNQVGMQSRDKIFMSLGTREIYSQTTSWTIPGGVLYTTNSGKVWNRVLTTSFSITSLVTPRQGTVLAASPLHLYRTTNNGVSWYVVDQINLRSMSYNDGITAAIDTAGKNVVQSSDGGYTWTSLGAMDTASVIAAGPHGSLLVAASRVWMRHSGPEPLAETNNGLPAGPVKAFAFDSTGNAYTVIAGGNPNYYPSETSCLGIYKLAAPTSVPAAEPGSHVVFQLYPNYPNPFNPSTTIRYVLPFKTPVRISIYNVAGQLITVAREAIEDAGSHQLTWDAGNVPTGLYLCEVRTAAGRLTQKLLLMK